jgi:hypothetical protein
MMFIITSLYMFVYDYSNILLYFFNITFIELFEMNKSDLVTKQKSWGDYCLLRIVQFFFLFFLGSCIFF